MKTIQQLLIEAKTFTEFCRELREEGLTLPNRYLHRLWRERKINPNSSFTDAQ